MAGISAGLTDASGLRINDWTAWWVSVSQRGVLIEIALVVCCGLIAWALASAARRAWPQIPDKPSILTGVRAFDGVLFPLLWLGLTYLVRLELARWQAVPFLRVVLPALVALVVIRIGVKVLQAAFPKAAPVRALERSISWGVWLCFVLWVTGLLPLLMDELDDVTWQMGGAKLSVAMLLRGAVTVGAVVMLALWLSAAIEARLLRAASGASLSVRIAIANAVRALLLFVGVLMALSTVGINLTALSVLGGAIGVGIGLGLQKLAANYVSGFVVLAERAIRIGDVVRVDGYEGQVTDIRTRYTVIRAVNGGESIVPNEMMVTQRVENLSLADRRVSRSTVVSVGYDSDVDLVIRLLREAALSSSRVLREPAPSVSLSAFGADGLEFTVGFWVDQPESGQMGLRSEVNLAILRTLRAHNIDIPYPQRVVHTVSDSAGKPAGEPASSEPAPGSAPDAKVT
ncbi:mechanosensitive ion channel family protein [Ottowia thiooxydans]|uniref:mechanosensitive ion channel family protein n=1 Tax=Ottowia thiooxydans TaxID=219182 RepID=UPI000687B64F|nr:mechanosensitive ion channel domain-containing protein [Ottowia thiooxydans]